MEVSQFQYLYANVQGTNTMRRIAIGLACIATILFACDKAAELTTFNLSTDATFTMPGYTFVSDTTITIATPNIATNSAKVFEEQGTAANLIKTVTLSSLTLTAMNPDSQDMGFLKTISISMNASGLSEIALASKSDIGSNVGTSLALDAASTDMLQYVKQDSISLKISAAVDESLLQDTEIKADMVFTVSANPL